jgi:uncharacterized coiled-coil protein SlyX
MPELNDSSHGDRLFPMTTKFDLDFHGTRFTVPKVSLFKLFEHQRGLFDATSYEVQCSVPLEIFELFVKALETSGKVPVTKENAGSISLLAKEFWLEDLLSECSALELSSTPLPIAILSERISKLELQISSQPLTIIAELKESIVSHDRRLESLSSVIEANSATLRTEIDNVRHSIQLFHTEVAALKSTRSSPSPSSVLPVHPSSTPSPRPSPTQTQSPMQSQSRTPLATPSDLFTIAQRKIYHRGRTLVGCFFLTFLV